MNTKHTPAPWKVRNERIVSLEYLDGKVQKDGIKIDIMQDITNESIVTITKGIQFKEQAEANAKLIAAAPELLEALDFLLKAAIHCDPFFETRWNIASDKAKAAINKATL